MREGIDDLKRHLSDIADLESVNRLLEWDECIYMPAGSADAHTRQKTTLARLAHEKLTSAALGRLLDELAAKAGDLPYDSDDAALVRVARRAYDRAARIPARFVVKLEEYKAQCYDAWYRAREENDFSIVAPWLERGVDLSRQYAGFFPGYGHVADPLIANQDEGMTVAILRPVFARLRNGLIPLLRCIAQQPEPDDSFLHKRYPKIQQLRFGQSVIGRCGYDFMRGRQDLSMHPFTLNLSIDDVRITTHVDEHSFFDSFSSTLHEAGHAMYDQGICVAYEGTPLANAASMGLHESQARLWENLVGRSRPFWSYFFPILKAQFHEQLRGVSLEAFYRAINKIKPSLIRTEADEVSYNLHVMIRFDLELALLEGTLAVEELPEAWASRYRDDLGVAPSTHADGVLQDVHWYCDLFAGSFQSYAIGNIISVLFMQQAVREHPDIARQMEQGDFTRLLSWLKKNLYVHGSKFTCRELIHPLTQDPLPVQPYLDYLHEKYREIYGLRPASDTAPFTAEREALTTSVGWSYS